MGVIQRWGRWKSLTCHQYLWSDASALNKLSEVLVKSHGFSKCLRIMDTKPKGAPFQEHIKTMVGPRAHALPTDQRAITSLFLPNERFASLRNASCPGAGGASSAFSASDLPAYTDSPADDPSTFCGTIPLTKRELREKREKEKSIDDDKDVSNVELPGRGRSVASII